MNMFSKCGEYKFTYFGPRPDCGLRETIVVWKGDDWFAQRTPLARDLSPAEAIKVAARDLDIELQVV